MQTCPPEAHTMTPATAPAGTDVALATCNVYASPSYVKRRTSQIRSIRLPYPAGQQLRRLTFSKVRRLCSFCSFEGVRFYGSGPCVRGPALDWLLSWLDAVNTTLPSPPSQHSPCPSNTPVSVNTPSRTATRVPRSHLKAVLKLRELRLSF